MASPIYVTNNSNIGPYYAYRLLNSVSIRTNTVTNINLCYSEFNNKLWFTCSRDKSTSKRNISYLIIKNLTEVEDLIYKLCYHRLYNPKGLSFENYYKKFTYDKQQHTFKIEPIHSRYETAISIFDDSRDVNKCFKTFNDNLDSAYKDILPKFIEYIYNAPQCIDI